MQFHYAVFCNIQSVFNPLVNYLQCLVIMLNFFNIPFSTRKEFTLLDNLFGLIKSQSIAFDACREMC